MKIIIDNRDFDSNQSPSFTIDIHACTCPYVIRDAIKLALEFDGCTKETINEVFREPKGIRWCKKVTFKQQEQ